MTAFGWIYPNNPCLELPGRKSFDYIQKLIDMFFRMPPVANDSHRLVRAERVRDQIEITDRVQIHISRCDVVGCFDELGSGVMQHIIDRA